MIWLFSFSFVNCNCSFNFYCYHSRGFFITTNFEPSSLSSLSSPPAPSSPITQQICPSLSHKHISEPASSVSTHRIFCNLSQVRINNRSGGVVTRIEKPTLKHLGAI
ncbi:hypothetical protein N3K66_003088 [Trichothecium roseum]|uniref:Uncharacterized protein n=1 Tax=Trichothecium roseum TaxID=47278 RepID=A0ACC0V4F1_9HYPO|nr:hypothetical protein N3K66_003088 [Trichothecium roseum]